MDVYGQLLIAGISTGSIYGLIALAFLIIYNSTQIVNFAQGEMVMVGAMMTFFGLSFHSFSYLSTFFIVIGSMIVIAFIFQHVLVKPLQKQGASMFSIIIGTIALGIVLSEGMGLWLGKQQYGVPPIIPNNPISLGNITILPQNLLIIIISWSLVISIWYFFNRTMTGLSLRAVSISTEGAQVSGIKISRMLAIGFTLSAVVSGIGGLLIAPVVGASPYLGLSIAVKGFAAAILGGMGNIYAGMIGGIIIGISESFFSFYIPSYAEAITFTIMLFMLVVKPTGLFPEHS
ncbi:branched-chain amino acid transport system permease protein [Salirhabdus euzebyi]|uniref:Branched-chain amino acid transport system permease protein n=1 Tax=Salirhabdus euzebyi TaxID=394506 RepID=A0A841Q5W9_9BACI|nr:branched-chain amino acid ABC transporter permease [Salirhabdus euzebyi]MBB6453712.1 branched-chain amino acid transport system permease protein [Salirhabdus euzebyi]